MQLVLSRKKRYMRAGYPYEIVKRSKRSERLHSYERAQRGGVVSILLILLI